MSTTPALKRAPGFRDLTLFYVVSGLSVRWVASAAAGGPSTLVVWVIALVGFFIPLAASMLELSSRYPQEGDLYVWTREASGDFFGFIAAWTYWMSNLPYFPAVLYFGAGSVLFAFGAHRESLASSGVYYAAFAVSWLAIITLPNIAGADVGKWLNNIGSVGSIVPLAVLCVLAAISGLHFGSATHFASANMVPQLSLRNAIFYSTIVFAFGGCEAGSFMGEEIKYPRRTIPWSLLSGCTVLSVGYIAGTLALLICASQRGCGWSGRIRIWVAPIVFEAGSWVAAGTAGAAGWIKRCCRRGSVFYLLPRACLLLQALIVICRQRSDAFIRASAHRGSQ
jgi:amino acid transporter